MRRSLESLAPETPETLFKFPRTPHLFWLGEASPRGDKVLSPREAKDLLRRPVAVEEKVDGACLGFSMIPREEIRVQSRGRYLTRGERGQFQPLWSWLARREDALRRVFRTDRIVFGEWCYARHTVGYDALPDWFLAFDVYDRDADRFWSRERRDDLAASIGLVTPPPLATGVFDRRRLEQMFDRSRFGRESAEGLYLRWDDGPWLAARAKLVRKGWVQAGDDHWSRRSLETNRLAESRDKTPEPQITPSVFRRVRSSAPSESHSA